MDQEQIDRATQASAEVAEEEASKNGTAPPPPDPAEHSPAEEQSAHELFEFSTYVHVGPGAAGCEDGENGRCANPLHFHGWCRMPNQFQHQSIREKAQAAKARRLRVLRDEETDARVILDGDIEETLRAGDKDAMIEELASKDWLQDYLAAVKELTEGEEAEYEHYEEDRERFRALSNQPEADRPAEEYDELKSRLDKFGIRVQEVFNENQRPLKESLAEKSPEELADLLREQRIDAEAQNAFNVAYAQYEWYIGTLKPRDPSKGLPTERYWPDFSQMLGAAPEIIEALEATFNELDADAGRKLKNS